MPRHRKKQNSQKDIGRLLLLIWDLLGELGKRFIFTFLVFAATFFFNNLIREKTLNAITPLEWWINLFGPIVLTAFTYFKEEKAKATTKNNLFDHKVIFEMTSSAIQKVFNLIGQNNHNNNENYLKDQLQYLQKTVEIILKEHNIDRGIISSNCMIATGNNLALESFDCDSIKRKKITLPIDQNRILPGAPEAFIKGEVVYVPDIRSNSISHHFPKNSNYLSFFSIPISDIHGNIFAVLNIDSTKKNQFKNIGFINNKIIPAITPIISLIQLEHDIADKIKTNKEKRFKRGVYVNPKETTSERSQGSNNT